MIWKVDPAKKGFSDLPKNVHIHRKHYSTYPGGVKPHYKNQGESVRRRK